MRIYFVRHGHPDYKNDCLTALGHKQAQAAAERLVNCGIEQIFASTRGRALETAAYTADKLGLGVIHCDFMREIKWQSIDDEPIMADGSPWEVASLLVAEGKSLRGEDWYTREPYCRSKMVGCIKDVANGFDALLQELGYKREGEYYRVVGDNTDKTVAVFSHGGASSAVLSHLFNIPFSHFCGMLHIDFTGVTVVDFSGEPGQLIYPKLFSSDAAHIEGIEAEN